MRVPAAFAALLSRRPALAGGIMALALVAGPVTLPGCQALAPGPVAPRAEVNPTANAQREERGAATVRALARAWRAADRAEFVTAAGRSQLSRRWAARTFRNLVTLGVHHVSWRYAGASDPLPAAGGATGPGSQFLAAVEIRWTPGTSSCLAPHRTETVTVSLQLRGHGDRVDVRGVQTVADPLPIWLLGALRVDLSSGGCLIHGPGVDTSVLGRLADRAVAEVSQVLRRDVAPVAVVLPATARSAADLLGETTVSLTAAAVTTTVDGGTSRSSPVQVVLNPAVFSTLRPRAARVVLAHEITHAATGATTATMPLWVAEGFADFVALRHGGVPVAVAGAPALDRVRRLGPPASLPTDADFAGPAPMVARAYAEAWLAFRLLAQRFGEPRTLAFYHLVRSGTPVERALARSFGVSRHALVPLWRASLERLAAR